MIDINRTMARANDEMERLKDAEFVLNFPLLKVMPIISALQLSMRHPQMPEPTGTVVRKFVDETLGVIERASPDLAAFLRLGDNPKYDRPAPAGDKIRKLAEKVAADLFVNGEGREAKRLVMEFDKKLSGGGWCRTAVVDRVETVLRQNEALTVNQELRAALIHSKHCQDCAEDWDSCEHGREANRLLERTNE